METDEPRFRRRVLAVGDGPRRLRAPAPIRPGRRGRDHLAPLWLVHPRAAAAVLRVWARQARGRGVMPRYTTLKRVRSFQVIRVLAAAVRTRDDIPALVAPAVEAVDAPALERRRRDHQHQSVVERRGALLEEVGRVALVTHNRREPIDVVADRDPHGPPGEGVRCVRAAEREVAAGVDLQVQCGLGLVRAARLALVPHHRGQGWCPPDHVREALLAPLLDVAERRQHVENRTGVMLDEIPEDVVQDLRSTELRSLLDADRLDAGLVHRVHDADQVGR